MENDRYTFTAFFHQAAQTRSAVGGVLKETFGQEGRDQLVAGGLAESQAVYRQGVRQGSRGIELETVGEHEEPNLRAVDGVVAVGDRIDDRLEDGADAVLGLVSARRIFDGGGAHIAFDKGHSPEDLLVQGARDVLGVQLMVCVPLAVGVTDRLDESAG